MKHALILGITALLMLAAAAWGQVSAPSVRYVSSAPSGACSQAPPVQVLNSSGAIYTCNNGTWAVQGGGSGSGTVSGQARRDRQGDGGDDDGRAICAFG